MRRVWIVFIAALLLFLSAPMPVIACLHGPSDFTGDLGANAYLGVLFQAEGREELILNVQVAVDSPQELKRLAWVVALPATPDAYSAKVGSSIFSDAFDLLPKPKGYGKGALAFSDDGVQDLGLHIKVVKAGPYVIHQVTGEGQAAVEGLNEWFKRNDFPTKPVEEMKFFVNHGYTFLCIRFDFDSKLGLKMLLPPGKATKGLEGDEPTDGAPLPPLRLSFATKLPFFPLKFSSHQGEFAVQLLSFTAQPIDWNASKSVLKQLGVTSRSWNPLDCGNFRVSPASFRGALKDVYGRILKEGRLASPKGWFLNNFAFEEINSKKHPIAKWSTDCVLQLDGDPLHSNLEALLNQAVSKDKAARAAATKGFRALGSRAAPGLARHFVWQGSVERRVLAAKLLSEVATNAEVQLLTELPSIVEHLSWEESGLSRVQRLLGETLLKFKHPAGLAAIANAMYKTNALPGKQAELARVQKCHARLRSLTGQDQGFGAKLTGETYEGALLDWVRWCEAKRDSLKWSEREKRFVEEE